MNIEESGSGKSKTRERGKEWNTFLFSPPPYRRKYVQISSSYPYFTTQGSAPTSISLTQNQALSRRLAPTGEMHFQWAFLGGPCLLFVFACLSHLRVHQDSLFPSINNWNLLVAVSECAILICKEDLIPFTTLGILQTTNWQACQLAFLKTA